MMLLNPEQVTYSAAHRLLNETSCGSSDSTFDVSCVAGDTRSPATAQSEEPPTRRGAIAWWAVILTGLASTGVVIVHFHGYLTKVCSQTPLTDKNRIA